MQSEYSTDLRVKIPEYFEKRGETYYKIEAYYEKRKKWTIDRSYKEFSDLHNKIHKKIPNMPILPEKSLLSLLIKPTDKELNKRRMELEKYLNALCFKKDVLVDPSFREFLEFDRYSNEEELAKYMTEIEDTGMEVLQMIYLPYSGVLMLGLGDSGAAAKLDVVMGMVAAPIKTNTFIHGHVVCYGEDPIGSLRFSKLWNQEVDSTVMCMHWEEDLTLLAVGLESGNISIFRVATEHQYQEADDYCTVKQHASSVTGVALIKSTATLVSISLDKNLIMTKLTEDATDRSQQKLHMHSLVKLMYDPQKERIFVADSVGTLYIYAAGILLLGVVDFPRQNHVTSFFWDPTPGFLFAGSKQGVIAIYEIPKYGKEKFTQIIGSIETIKNISDMCFISSSRQLLVSNDCGHVLFVNSQNAASFYSLDAHSKEITALCYLPDLKLLITASRDKSVKFWRYPFDPEKDSGSLLYKSTMIRAKKQQQTRGYHPPDDDYQKETENKKTRNLNYQYDSEDDDEDDFYSTKKSTKDYDYYGKTKDNYVNSNYDYYKRYDSFKDPDPEEEAPATRPYNKNKNLSIHDDSKITQREEDDSHKHHELGWKSKHEKIKEARKRDEEDEDSEEDIVLPKNPFAKNALPIPFTMSQPGKDSDLKGWEAGVEEEEEENPEKLKKATRPLVSHFREFPTESKIKDYDTYVSKRKKEDDDEEEEEEGLSGWERREEPKPRAKLAEVKGGLEGEFFKSQLVGKIMKSDVGKYVASEVTKIKLPESISNYLSKDNEEDDGLSGWAR